MLRVLAVVACGQYARAEISSDACKNLEKANKIVKENCLPGNSAVEWDVNGAGDMSIQGFAKPFSINAGDKIDFKIKTDSDNYHIDIFRMGYYGGEGARLVETITPSVSLPQEQPECFFEKETWLLDCDTWHVSATWQIPLGAVSGLYVARPARDDFNADFAERDYQRTHGDKVERLDRQRREHWRQDNSMKRGDKQHARPGADPDPYLPPELRGKVDIESPRTNHSYGATGLGPMFAPLINPRASHIWFVVREDGRHADIVLQTSDPTWQAYNGWGTITSYGSFHFPWTHPPTQKAMHVPDSPKDFDSPRSYKMSYNRPIDTRGHRAVNMPLNADYPALRFLEKAGYDVAYMSGVDAHVRGESIKNYKSFVSVGHDEYVSGQQRKYVEAARDAGTHLHFWSGNEYYWRIRWEKSPVSGMNNDLFPVMVCYKETQAWTKIDPDEKEWTGTFRDDRKINPLGADPENSLTGTMFSANAHRDDALEIPAWYYGRLRVWRHTPLSETNNPEQIYRSQNGILGHEWDSDFDNGFRPDGLIRLSESRYDNFQHIQDEGSVFGTGANVHHLTLYKANSGALVFGAGTVQWAWGLDDHHEVFASHIKNAYCTRVEHSPSGADSIIQQATVNIFADMGIQPTTLQQNLPFLTQAIKSDDETGPKSTVLNIKYEIPDDFDKCGLQFCDAKISVVASATDLGGVVAGMEVSFNQGKRWHPMSYVVEDVDSEFLLEMPGGSSSEHEPLMFYQWQNEHHNYGDAFPLIKDLIEVKADKSTTERDVQEQFFKHVQVRAVDDSCNIGPTALWKPEVAAEHRSIEAAQKTVMRQEL